MVQDVESEETLTRHLDHLKSRIESTKEERRRLIEEVKALREERRRLIDSKRELVESLKRLREERNSLFETLNKLRDERQKLLQELKFKLEEYRIARQLAEKEGNMAKISVKRLQRRLQELEWRQMTSVLAPREEKRLVDEIARLEDMILRVKRARRQVLSLLELQAEIKALRLKLADLKGKINEAGEKIGSVKSRMASLIRDIEGLNSRIDEYTVKVNGISSRIDELSRTLDELYEEYRETLIKIKEIKVSRQTGLQVDEIESKREEIRRKMERGEPLSIEELKILYGEF